MSETASHDHELEVLEEDQTVPPRPEEQIADAREAADASEGSGASGFDSHDVNPQA
jgi:hypothetical protein